ncbi:hypothetical protein PI124_g12029 [Phytophthora idaei]|nr:hypothetical protein PI124_g12029 [Phytophthora idaei]
MKLANAIATSAVVMVAIASPTSALQGRVERVLILSGEPVPSGTKASLGDHYRNGTQAGEQIKVVSMMNHPNYSENIPNSDDFMIVELERPSKFKPMELAAADDSDFKPGTIATTMGWGKNAETNGNFSYELQRVDVPLVSDDACGAYATVDSSMVCAGGVANHNSCEGDFGGLLIIQSAEGEDVLVGIVSWANDDTCWREGYYGVYSRVSSARDWIETITSGSGTCLP